MKNIWIIAYVASILVANLTLNIFYQLPVFGMLSMGTIFFAFVFTLRDRLHDYGLKTVFLAIGLALIVNTTVAILYDTPWQFVVASFIAIALSELADTAMFQRFMEKSWLRRVLLSNSVSVPLDSILFNVLAFYGAMSTTEILEIIWADILFKTLIAAGLAWVLNARRSAVRRVVGA